MREAGAIDGMWQELGRQLAALRRAARLTQAELGALIGFSRTAVSVAEIGRQIYSRYFWEACDKALATGGVLTDGADQIGAVRSAVENAAACAAQEAREARPLAAFTLARDQAEVFAGVSARCGFARIAAAGSWS
jgi:transcriptional regulator with XRE-family HTH domain